MTHLGADAERIRARCQAFEEAFALFERQLDCYVSCYYEFQTTNVTCLGLKLSQTILMDAVVHYYRDIDRYKRLHGFSEDARANARKVGAFTTYWLATKRPIYDMRDELYAPIVNYDFAIFVGLTLATVDPHQARVAGEGVAYKQLKSLLSEHTASPDSLVPLFEALFTLAPG